MKDLDYPFNSDYIIRKKKSLKKQLLADENTKYIGKKIAILGGETTENIKLVLELFLLNYGIRPDFYESEYNRYYEDGMFPNSDLEEFKPDIIYVCTCVRNIIEWPVMTDSKNDVDTKRQALMDKFTGLWDTMAAKYHCPIIQNNFEYPFFRLMGNKDASDYHGRINYVTSISASYGLDKWSDPYYWYMYKYAVAVPAIPYLSFNVAKVIKSIYGKNKKAFNLDLDNTLWGGIVGEDGADNIEIGHHLHKHTVNFRNI